MIETNSDFSRRVVRTLRVYICLTGFRSEFILGGLPSSGFFKSHHNHTTCETATELIAVY